MRTEDHANLQKIYDQCLLTREYALLITDLLQPAQPSAAMSSTGTNAVLHGADGPWRLEHDGSQV
jgi:hypothetical protein